MKNQSFLSFLTLLACLAAVAAHLAALKPYGTRDHLGGSFVWKNAVEMPLAREFLYPLHFPVYAYLKDGFVILLTVVIVASIVWLFRRQTWEKNQFYLVVIAGSSIFTIAYAVIRLGLSTAFQSYQTQPFYHYFYGMNLVAELLIAMIGQDISQATYTSAGK